MAPAVVAVRARNARVPIALFLLLPVRWGRWDMYMLTQEAEWAIKPDYLAFFKPASYRWMLPPLNDPTLQSQLTTSARARNFRRRRPCELLPAIRRRTAFLTRLGLYFCAVVIFYISLAGVASVQMESMLRYEFCTHALIVLALLHYLHQFRLPPVLVTGVRHGGGCASRRGRAQFAGLVRLEFYEGKLGCLTN